MTTPISRQDEFASVKTHRKQTRRLIYLPMFLVFMALFLLVLILILPSSPIYMGEGGNGLSIIANFYLVCFALVPTMLCCGAVYFALFVSIYYMNSAHRSSAKGLRKLQGYSRIMADKTGEYGDKVSEESIKVNSRFAFLQPILSIFDPPEDEDGEEKNGTHK